MTSMQPPTQKVPVWLWLTDDFDHDSMCMNVGTQLPVCCCTSFGDHLSQKKASAQASSLGASGVTIFADIVSTFSAIVQQ